MCCSGVGCHKESTDTSTHVSWSRGKHSGHHRTAMSVRCAWSRWRVRVHGQHIRGGVWCVVGCGMHRARLLSLGTTTAVSTRTHPTPQAVVGASGGGQINLSLALAAPSSGRRGAHVGHCNRDEVHGFMNLSPCTVCVEACGFAPLCPWNTLHSCCCACGSHQCLWQTTDCVTSTWSRCCIAPRCVGILLNHTVLCCSRQHCPAPCPPPMCTNTTRPDAAEAHTACVAPRW